jgi:hypothetical protein
MTLQGLDLLAECMTGLELHFSRVVLGDGELEDISPAALKERTEMVNEVLELPIIAYKTEGDGTMVMSTQLKNVDLQQGFLNREIGIFAIDPQTETEILYAYRNVGNYGEYIPAGTGSEAWNLIYDAITVIDQAPNVTVEISGGDAYVPTADFQDHISSTNPPPNFLNIGQEVSTAPAVFVDSGTHRKLDYIPIFDLKQQILGNESDIPLLNSRVNQLEREQANIVLQMEAENMMPDCNMLLTEDFQEVNQLDTLTVDVTSCAAGDDSVDVQNNYGIIVGSWYWITDGVHCEYVQVKSTIKNGDIYRVILTDPLVNTYDIDMTKLYRTTAWIASGVAYGSGDVLGAVYKPTVTWQGTTAGGTAESDEPWGTSQGNAGNFSITGDVIFTADDMVTLE